MIRGLSVFSDNAGYFNERIAVIVVCVAEVGVSADGIHHAGDGRVDGRTRVNVPWFGGLPHLIGAGATRGCPVLYAPEVNVLDRPQEAQQVQEAHAVVGAVVVVDDFGKCAGDIKYVGIRCDGVLQLCIIHPLEFPDTSVIGGLDELDEVVSRTARKRAVE